jgi:hypothetical protein
MSDISNEIVPFGGIIYINGIALQIVYPKATGRYVTYYGTSGCSVLGQDLRTAPRRMRSLSRFTPRPCR